MDTIVPGQSLYSRPGVDGGSSLYLPGDCPWATCISYLMVAHDSHQEKREDWEAWRSMTSSTGEKPMWAIGRFPCKLEFECENSPWNLPRHRLLPQASRTLLT